jgi:hypothetical protein
MAVRVLVILVRTRPTIKGTFRSSGSESLAGQARVTLADDPATLKHAKRVGTG